jgi:hypothetical protein
MGLQKNIKRPQAYQLFIDTFLLSHFSHLDTQSTTLFIGPDTHGNCLRIRLLDSGLRITDHHNSPTSPALATRPRSEDRSRPAPARVPATAPSGPSADPSPASPAGWPAALLSPPLAERAGVAGAAALAPAEPAPPDNRPTPSARCRARPTWPTRQSYQPGPLCRTTISSWVLAVRSSRQPRPATPVPSHPPGPDIQKSPFSGKPQVNSLEKKQPL